MVSSVPNPLLCFKRRFTVCNAESEQKSDEPAAGLYEGSYVRASAFLGLVQSIILAKVLGPVQLNAKSEARHAALMFENEAKVPYVYAPQEKAVASVNNKNKNKKKK